MARPTPTRGRHRMARLGWTLGRCLSGEVFRLDLVEELSELSDLLLLVVGLEHDARFLQNGLVSKDRHRLRLAHGEPDGDFVPIETDAGQFVDDRGVRGSEMASRLCGHAEP